MMKRLLKKLSTWWKLLFVMVYSVLRTGSKTSMQASLERVLRRWRNRIPLRIFHYGWTRADYNWLKPVDSVVKPQAKQCVNNLFFWWCCDIDLIVMEFWLTIIYWMYCKFLCHSWQVVLVCHLSGSGVFRAFQATQGSQVETTALAKEPAAMEVEWWLYAESLSTWARSTEEVQLANKLGGSSSWHLAHCIGPLQGRGATLPWQPWQICLPKSHSERAAADSTEEVALYAESMSALAHSTSSVDDANNVAAVVFSDLRRAAFPGFWQLAAACWACWWSGYGCNVWRPSFWRGKKKTS